MGRAAGRRPSAAAAIQVPAKQVPVTLMDCSSFCRRTYSARVSSAFVAFSGGARLRRRTYAKQSGPSHCTACHYKITWEKFPRQAIFPFDLARAVGKCSTGPEPGSFMTLSGRRKRDAGLRPTDGVRGT
jgi:hypothetical protein